MQVSDIKKSTEWDNFEENNTKSIKNNSKKKISEEHFSKDESISEFEKWCKTMTDEISFVVNAYLSISHKQSEIASNMMEIGISCIQQWFDWNLKFMNSNRT